MGGDHCGVSIYPKGGNVMFMDLVLSIEMERWLGSGSAHLEEKQPRRVL